MALGCAGRSRALSSPALRGRTCLLPSSLWQVSSCPHIQTWDGLVSQEPVLCPSLRLVQGPHHLSASIQPFRGAWSLSGTMALLCPHLHQPQLLMHPRSCVAPIYGVCWDSSLIPLTLGASAWSVIASRGRHDVFALPPAKGWRVSLYLLGTILQANLRELQGWEHLRGSHSAHGWVTTGCRRGQRVPVFPSSLCMVHSAPVSCLNSSN